MADIEDASVDGPVLVSSAWRRQTMVTIALLPVTIAPFLWVLPDPIPLGVGAAGWYAALLLRIPIVLVLTKCLGVSKTDLAPFIIAMSGPCEESCRVLAVVFLDYGRSFETLYSIGVGWAGIEVLYTMLNGVLILRLAQDPSDEAKEAREMIKTTNGGKNLDEQSPVWGFIERISANMLHISFSIALQYGLWIGAPSAIIHSIANGSVVYLSQKKGISWAEGALFIVALGCYLSLVLVSKL